jgi:hypothetical protein
MNIKTYGSGGFFADQAGACARARRALDSLRSSFRELNSISARGRTGVWTRDGTPSGIDVIDERDVGCGRWVRSRSLAFPSREVSGFVIPAGLLGAGWHGYAQCTRFGLPLLK